MIKTKYMKKKHFQRMLQRAWSRTFLKVINECEKDIIKYCKDNLKNNMK